MAIPQQQTNQTTETATSVAGAQTLLPIDLVALFSSVLQQVVARQVMTVGDPTNPAGVAQVTNTVPGGQEFALLTRITPGSPELQMIITELRNIRAELQVLNTNFGVSMPATAPALQETL